MNFAKTFPETMGSVIDGMLSEWYKVHCMMERDEKNN